RHRRGPFLLLREKFFGFTDLGTLQVAQFNRNFFQRRADQSKRRDVVRVPVALNDLRRNGSCPEIQPPHYRFFDIGREMRKRTDRTGKFSDAHCLSRFVEPRLLTLHLIAEKGKVQSERRGLRMDTVRAAYDDRWFSLISW